MSAVTKQEIVEALRGDWSGNSRNWLADRILQHGIAPPDGMVLVPKEPTREMIDAAWKTYNADRPHDISFRFTYAQMLAAAPEVKP